jgi:hypothetical protein
LGYCDQSPFDFDFFEAAEHESTEAVIVFDITENRLNIKTPLLSFG